jgi:hypothetical protein
LATGAAAEFLAATATAATAAFATAGAAFTLFVNASEYRATTAALAADDTSSSL